MRAYPSALVARGPGDAVIARRLGLALSPRGGFVLVGLDPGLLRARARQFGIEDRALSEMAADRPPTLRLAAELGFDRFALIQRGDLQATAYDRGTRSLPVRPGRAAVNDALESIGVLPEGGWDAYDMLGLDALPLEPAS